MKYFSFLLITAIIFSCTPFVNSSGKYIVREKSLNNPYEYKFYKYTWFMREEERRGWYIVHGRELEVGDTIYIRLTGDVMRVNMYLDRDSIK